MSDVSPPGTSPAATRADLEALRADLEALRAEMATKADLEREWRTDPRFNALATMILEVRNELRAEMAAQRAWFQVEMAAQRAWFQEEMARHIGAGLEEIRRMLAPVLDKTLATAANVTATRDEVDDVRTSLDTHRADPNAHTPVPANDR